MILYPSMLLHVLGVVLLSCVKGLFSTDYEVHNITLDGPNTPIVFSSLPFLIHTPTVTSVTKVNGDQSTKVQSPGHGVINNLLRKGGLLNKGTTTSITQPNVTRNQATTQDYLNKTSNPTQTQPQPSYLTPELTKSQQIKRKTNFQPYLTLHTREYSNVKNSTKDLITLGTIKHNAKQLNDTMEYLANNSGGNSNLDLEELERFLHIKQPDMNTITKPLIYYRTNNETLSQTKANTTETITSTNNVFSTEDAKTNLKDKGREEAFLCVTKCPRSVVSIEITIEEHRRICTGILLEENFVMTSGSCIPLDWRPWFVTHPGRIFVRPLEDTYTIKTKKVRFYSDTPGPWTESADIIILKIETSGDEGAVVRSSFDPSRMYVEESECYLYVYKDKTDKSIGRFIGRMSGWSVPEYESYYYDQQYEDAEARPLDLIKLRIDNLFNKSNFTLLGVNSSQLLFSIYRKRFNYTTGVIFCDNSLDSILFTSLHLPTPSPPLSILVLFNLDAIFYSLNRFIYDFSPPMMQIMGARDYFNVDETGRDGATRPSSGNMYSLQIVIVVLLLCF